MPEIADYEELKNRIRELESVEAQLRESEARFRAIIEKSPMGIAIVNDQYQYTYANNEFCNIAGYPENEIIGANFFFLLAEESKALSIDRYVRRQRGETVPDRYEVSFIKKNGARRIGEVQSAVFMDAGGKANSLIQVYDITDRKLAETALSESEKKYRALVENAGEAIFVAQDGMLKFVNPATEKIIGYPKAALTSKIFTEFIHPDDLGMVMDRHRRRLKGEAMPSRYDFRIMNASGDARWVELNVVAIEWEGRPATLNFLTDITARVAIENSLRKSEEKYRFLAEKMGDIVWTMDLDLKTTYVSPSVFRVLGFTPEERKLQTVDGVMTPASLDHVISVFHQELTREKSGDFDPDRTVTLEVEYYHKNGSTVWMENIVKGMRDSKGKLSGIFGLSRDITERKQLEMEQKNLQDQLSHAQKMESVGRLAGGVAHDFNNMLSVILGHAELALKKTGPDQPAFGNLVEIQKAAGRSADLTRQLLAFARKQTIAPKMLNLNETIEGMLNMLRRLIGENIDLAWMPSTDIWPIRMDPTQIDQILANLCVNARDAIAGIGKITIETANVMLDETICRQEADLTPGAYVLLTVSDTGAGMDKSTRENLFEPFFTTKAVGRGTGLGLATVYGIVKQNNGLITVNSEPGMGTTFKIYIPRNLTGGDRHMEGLAVPAASGGHETILVAEDEPVILEMITIMLTHQGYTVIAAGTPGEAVRLAEENAGAIHLLMTDVVMPEMNGRDLAETLMAKHPGLKRLFMSGYTADAIAHHGMLDEGVHFIQKPFSMEELTAKVREALENHRAAAVLTS